MNAPLHEPYLRRLAHRWLVEYNPLYFFSAALTLGGLSLLSRGLLASENFLAKLAVSGIAELYGWALIGAAALLMRFELRRPAVLLALLAALYQGDLTLHNEAVAYFGVSGLLTSCLWVASFVAKVVALGWAMKLRIPRHSASVAGVGALGVALLPRFVVQSDGFIGSRGVALWLFGTAAAALFAEQRIESREPLDAWGRTVLSRSIRATVGIWTAAALLHFWFWTRELSVEPVLLMPVTLLLSTRRLRRELAVWGLVGLTVLFTGLLSPTWLATVAGLGACTLLLRAFRKPERVPTHEVARPSDAYRAPSQAPPPEEEPEPRVAFVVAGSDERRRLYVGVASFAHLALWTETWGGGSLPAHSLALDLALVVGLAFLFVRLRVYSAALPVVALGLHYAVARRILTLPDSALGWGLWAVGLGFALLVFSVAGTLQYERVRRRELERSA